MRGVAADALNQVIITGGSEGKVKFWKFENKGNIIIKKDLWVTKKVLLILFLFYILYILLLLLILSPLKPFKDVLFNSVKKYI